LKSITETGAMLCHSFGTVKRGTQEKKYTKERACVQRTIKAQKHREFGAFVSWW
jgi:hypothetical protein